MIRSLVSLLLVGALAALGLFGCTSNDSASTTVAGDGARAKVKMLVKNSAPTTPSVQSVPVIDGINLVKTGWQSWQSNNTGGTGQMPIDLGQGGLGGLPIDMGAGGAFFQQFMTPVLDRPTPIVFPEDGTGYVDLGELSIPAGCYDQLQVIWDQASADYLQEANLPFDIESMTGVFPIIGGLRADPGQTIVMLVDVATGEASVLQNTL
jgi:hypothetical protein